MNKTMWLAVACMTVVGLAGCVEDTGTMKKSAMTKKSMTERRLLTEQDFRKAIVGKKIVSDHGQTVFTADGKFSGFRKNKTYTGTWTWVDGFYCRTLVFDGKQRPDACQVVVILGDNKVKFIADKGSGRTVIRTIE